MSIISNDERAVLSYKALMDACYGNPQPPNIIIGDRAMIIELMAKANPDMLMEEVVAFVDSHSRPL